MGKDNVLSTSFIQKVFDEISLEHNQDLWMSDQDILLQDRIEFLASYSETMFKEELFNLDKRKHLSKNLMLCRGFKTKAEKLMQSTEDWTQILHLLNLSLSFAPTDEDDLVQKIIFQRAEILDKLDSQLRDGKEMLKEANIGFSDCVTIEQTELQGRYTVANRDIEPGEIIAVDRPVVKHLDKEYTKTHCWHCLRSTQKYATVPCSMCSGVLFCSELCRKISQDTYHKYECGLTDILYKADLGVWILAHRSVASHPKEIFLEQKLDSRLVEYSTLVSHYGSDKYSAPELMKEALVCVFLTRCLQATGYFGDEPILEPYFGKEELQIALWIHRFMRIVRFNCHAIREVSNNQNSSIGVAVNPTLAMINHSCDSNYGRVWKLDEDLVVAYATRPIKKGDEITDGYSGIFSNVPQEDRAQIHSRYHFDCLCQACQDSWPLKYQLPTAVPKNKEKLKELIKAKNSKELTVPEKTELMKQTLTEAYSILPKPHFILCQLEDEFYNHLRINQ